MNHVKMNDYDVDDIAFLTGGYLLLNISSVTVYDLVRFHRLAF